MTRLLFLPVSRFYVRYRVASGRPFSQLDRLVLRAIIERRGATLDELKKIFSLPERPLLENLVTLFHESWICMNSQGLFLVTEDGRRASSSRATPVSMRVSDESKTILMEEVAGQCIIPRNGRHDRTEDELRRDNLYQVGRRVRAVVGHLMPDQGILRGLLNVRRGDRWIHSIDPPIARGRCSRFLPLVADPESGRIIGLPDQWLPLLEDTLLAEASRMEPTLSLPQIDEFSDIDLERPEPKQIMLRAENVIVSAEEHAAALRDVLERAPARSSILIAGERFNPARLEKEWGELISAALARGVNIDLLWRSLERIGAEEPAERQLERSIALLDSRSGGGQPRGQLRTNSKPSRSRARFILLVVPGSESAEAWIGGWEWLAPPSNDEAAAFSIRVRHPEILAALAHSATALLETATEGTLSPLPEMWRELAGQLDQCAGLFSDQEEGNTTARLLRDREIDRIVLERITRAQGCVEVRIGEEGTAASLLEDIDETAAERIAFIASFPKPDRFETSGVSWIVQSGVGAESVLADDALIVAGSLVGSRSFGEPPLKDIGLLVEGGPLRDQMERFRVAVEKARG